MSIDKTHLVTSDGLYMNANALQDFAAGNSLTYEENLKRTPEVSAVKSLIYPAAFFCFRHIKRYNALRLVMGW